MLGKITKISEIWRSKKFRITLLGLVIFGIAIGGYSAIPYPRIEGADIPDTVYKVSFNAPFTLHFNQRMDKASVESLFKIHPRLNGDFVWPDSKTLEFHPSRYLTIGDDYRIVIGAGARSVYNKTLNSDIALQFLVTGPPFVKFVSPSFSMEDPIEGPMEDPIDIPIVQSDQVITVMFDRPMQWPSPNQLALGENLLLIDPQVYGQYRFLGSSAFQFIPDSWPIGTRFNLTVPAGIPARDGGETEEETNWMIETAPLLVAKTNPKIGDENVSLDASIAVYFNQPVDLEQIRPGANVLLYPSNDLDAAENPKYDGFFNTEAVYGKDSRGKEDKSILIFTPTFPYLNETEYKFVIKAGLTSPSTGNINVGMKEDFELDFKTAAGPGIAEFIPPTNENPNIFVTFNTPITAREIIKNLSFSPELPAAPGIILDKNSKQAEIICDFSSGVKYTFELKAGTSDAAGNKIKEDYKTAFIAPSVQSKLRWESSGDMKLFTTEENPQFTVRSKNTDELILRLCEVSDRSFIETNGAQNWQNYGCSPRSYTKKLESGDSQTISLNLTEFFGDDWEQGAYYFSVEGDDGQAIYKVFLITDTSLVLKKSANSLLIWAQDVSTGEPVSRMELTVFSYDGEEITRGVTDGDGVYKITRELGEGIYVIGKKDLEEESRWTIGNEYWSIPMAYTGRSKWIYPGESRLFLISDKSTVFAGGKINVKGIWRIDNDAQLTLPETKQVELAVEDAEQNTLITKTLPLRRNGSFDTELEVPLNMPDGTYRLASYTKQGEILSSNDVLITVLKEDLPFEMQWADPRYDFYNKDIILFSLSARYMLGMPAASLRGQWQLYKKPYYFNKHQDGVYYSFGEITDTLCIKGACETEEIWMSGGEFVFDPNGLAQIVLTDKEGNLQSGYEYRLVANAQSIDGKEVSKEINFKVHPGDYYTGLNFKHYIIQSGDSAEGTFIAVHPEGHLLENKKIKLSLTHVENGKEGKTWYEKILATDAGPKDIKIPITSRMPAGIYKLKASGQDGGSLTELKLYVLSEKMDKLMDGLAIIADQTEYFVGGKANLLINYPSASSKNKITALITYERGGILGYKVVKLETPLTEVSIPITEEMTPNVQISSLIIQPKIETANVNLLISKRDRDIKIDITSHPPAPSPGEEVTLKIHTYDYQNRPVPSVVTLNITKAENSRQTSSLTPFDYFYHPRASQISTSSNISISGSSIPASQSMVSPPANPQIGSDSSSAYFNPVILTDENGYTEVKITLPNEFANWQISAIATNDAKNFGAVTSDLSVKKQLIIRPIVPAFIIPGDQITVETLIQNPTNQDIETKIELLADNIEIKGGSKKNVFIGSGQTIKAQWNAVISLSNTGNSLKFTFRSDENQASVMLPIKYPWVSETIGGSGLLDDRWISSLRVAENVIPNMGGLYVSVSGTSENIVEKYTNTINKYPYPSTEKLANELIGKIILHHPELSDMNTKKMADEIQMLVTDILSRQRPDGGYAFWNGAESDPWLTAYVSLALHRADVSGASQNSATQFIWNNLDDIESVSDRLFILWALSEMEQYDTRSAVTAFQSREESTISGRAFLLMNLNNLVQAGQKSVYPYLERLQAEIADLKTVDEEWIYFEEGEKDTFDTDIRSTAIMLVALSKLSDDNPLMMSIVKYLTSLNPYRFTPQEGIWAAMALSAFMEPGLDSDYTVRATVNQETVIEQDVRPGNEDKIYYSFTPISSLKKYDQINEITIDKDGIGTLYFDIDLTYYPSNDSIQPVEKNIVISRDYYRLEDYGRTQPLSEMQAGSLYRGVLTLIIPEDFSYIVAEEHLPAGLKALSFNPAVASLLSRYEREDMIKAQGLNWIENPLWNFNHYMIEDERLLLFAEHLPAGVYEVDYLVQAGLPGKYNHLPASVRQIYNPSIYARTEGEWMEIK